MGFWESIMVFTDYNLQGRILETNGHGKFIYIFGIIDPEHHWVSTKGKFTYLLQSMFKEC